MTFLYSSGVTRWHMTWSRLARIASSLLDNFSVLASRAEGYIQGMTFGFLYDSQTACFSYRL